MRTLVGAVVGVAREIDLNPPGAELVNLFALIFTTVMLTIRFWAWVL